MLEFIKDAVNALADPMASAVDFVGDKIGLPPVLTNSIKAVAGGATGNVMTVSHGATGIVSELQKNPAAETEFRPASDSTQAQDGYASTAQNASAACSSGTLEPSVLEYQDSLKTLLANYGILDTLCGSRNEKFDVDTLKAAANNSNLSPELRKAARFLLDHPEYRNMVDTAGKGGSVDGTISLVDVQRALEKVNSDIARYGVRQPSTPTPAPSTPPAPTPAPSTPPAPTPAPSTPPAPTPAPSTPPVSTQPPPTGQPTPPTQSPPPTCPAPTPGTSGGASSGVSDIINNPHMSLEEKLQAILTLITRDTDDEILDVMNEMASVRDQRAALGTDESSRAQDAKLETTMEQLNLRLQRLMEKRKQMFDLMSNISAQFNEMAKQAIQNLGRA